MSSERWFYPKALPGKRGQALSESLFAWSPLHSVCHQLFPTKGGWQFDPTLLLTQRLQPHPFL